MIISQDGYSVEYYEMQNRITIMLPQTLGTLTNTRGAVRTRKTRLTDIALASFLELARYICEGREGAKMTNADKIRQMSEDELAEWIVELTSGDRCPPGHELRCMHDEDTCAGCWFRWLDTEVSA